MLLMLTVTKIKQHQYHALWRNCPGGWAFLLGDLCLWFLQRKISQATSSQAQAFRAVLSFCALLRVSTPGTSGRWCSRHTAGILAFWQYYVCGENAVRTTSILGEVLLFDHLLFSHCVPNNPSNMYKWPFNEQQNIYVLYELPCLMKEAI